MTGQRSAHTKTLFGFLNHVSILVSFLLLFGIFCSPLCSTPPSGDSSFDRQWAVVDSLEQKGLYKSAYAIVEEIYSRAKRTNTPGHCIKALLYQLQLKSSFEEEAENAVNSITTLKQEISQTIAPTKNILHSVLGSLYWDYYCANRYLFAQRTQRSEPVSDDIRTWDLRTIVAQCMYHFQKSLDNESLLKKTSLSQFDVILLKGDSSAQLHRPTLYDFLCHRAIDFYSNEEPDLIKPAMSFEASDPILLATADKCIRLSLSSSDSLSMQLKSVQLFQKILSFHMNDKDPHALIDADLKRLQYLLRISVHPQKDSLFIQTMNELRKKYKSHASYPEIIHALAQVYYKNSQNYNPLSPEDNSVRYLAKIAYDLCKSAIASTSDTTYGTCLCKTLMSEISKKELLLTTEPACLPQTETMALVSYKNVTGLTLRIVKAEPFQFYEKSINSPTKDFLKYLVALPVQKQWNVSFFNTDDYQKHQTEIPLPALPAGFYILLASTQDSFPLDSAALFWKDIWSSDIAYTRRQADNGSTEFFITHRKSGDLLTNAKAVIYKINSSQTKGEERVIEKGRFTPNADACIAISRDNEGYYFIVEFRYNNQILHTPQFYTNGYYAPSPQKSIVKTLFFTDRALYRPSQTIYFKGIMIQVDGEKNQIVPRQPTKITFFDANYQKISEMNAVTNEFGSFSGSFQTPSGILPGVLSLSNTTGSCSFRVEEYKRPTFEIVFDSLKGSHALGDSVTITGKARSYSGAVIDNAQIRYRIVRTSLLPTWTRYSSFWCEPKPEIELSHGFGKTDQSGSFSLTFFALPDKSVSPKLDPKFSYQIIADITDISGETQSAETECIIGYTALNIVVSIPEKVKTSVSQSFPVRVTNLQGVSIPATVSISISSLKPPKRLLKPRLWAVPDITTLPYQEFANRFPNNPYKDENLIQNYEREKEIFTTIVHTPQDSLFSCKDTKSWKRGAYVVNAKTTDTFGKEVTTVAYFTLYDEKDSKPPVPVFDWFVLDKQTAEVGDSLMLLYGSESNDVTMLYEIESKSLISSRQILKCNKEQKKLSIPVIEAYRGNFSIHLTFVKQGRCFQYDQSISVPYSNKLLDISFATFRDKLAPGQKEQWTITIKDKKGRALVSELMAGLYDASLDKFTPHTWLMDLYPRFYSHLNWESREGFLPQSLVSYEQNWNRVVSYPSKTYQQLNFFGFSLRSPSWGGHGFGGGTPMMAFAPGSEMDKSEEKVSVLGSTEPPKIQSSAVQKQKSFIGKTNQSNSSGTDLKSIATRTNFNETAFFFPQIQTNKQGTTDITFTVPEALTRWRFMGLAHSKELQVGYSEKFLLTQKQLMVSPQLPRFFREHDTIEIIAKITNLSDNDQSGQAQLFFSDALTMKPIDSLMHNTKACIPFAAPKSQSTRCTWRVVVPHGLSAVVCKIVASSGQLSDGEETTLPVLTNRMLVIETLPLPIRGKQTKQFTLPNLSTSSQSKTLNHQKLTLEFTENPIWYAVTALPFLMESGFECSEHIFSRLYSHSIGLYVTKSQPRIKQVFDLWKTITPDALLSNLQKNEELKNRLLQQTPWVLEALDESQRKQRIALFFDTDQLNNQLHTDKEKLFTLQSSKGGWPWFPGMEESRYITQHILSGLGHLEHLGITTAKNDHRLYSMILSAASFCDGEAKKEYDFLYKNIKPTAKDSNNLSVSMIQYLYCRSLLIKDFPIPSQNEELLAYYKKQSKRYWTKNSRYMQGMIALALYRMNDTVTARSIIASLLENALHSEEMGMYWNDMSKGYYWYQHPIETMSLLIEAFHEIAHDQKSVDEMKVWLLKNKQTTDWKTTKATADAVYSLLLTGTNWLNQEASVEITVGKEKIDPKKRVDIKREAGSGYFKTSWNSSEVTSDMGVVTVQKKDDGVSWGALYWNYFEQLDKIKPHATPLQLTKKLYREKPGPTGPLLTPLSAQNVATIGDKIIVRIELRVDRDMEYVHLKDMRASGFEPITVLSQYVYQDGLGYYQSTRDASTDFFFSFIPKGTYVFEYPIRATNTGDFSNGISTIQCMYAPEFSSHSEGIRVKIR